MVVSAQSLPRVSVVIPTYRRPMLVRRAVVCALAQSVREIEVIVVCDGQDAQATDATRCALDTIEDDRIKIIAPGQQLGNGAARNVGIDAAAAPVIALIDDDDEWFPDKLEAQLPLCDSPATLVTCRIEARVGEDETHVWPRRQPRENEPIGEYLFCPRRPGTGEGMIQTSTWLMRTDLLRRVRFAEGLRRYVDLDWILRAAANVPDFQVQFANWPDPLAVWNIEPDRERVSNIDNGTFALEFAKERRELLSPRAYAGFILTLASQSAAAAGRRPGYGSILRAARDGGQPTLAGLLNHTLHYAVPRRLLRGAVSLLSRRSAR